MLRQIIENETFTILLMICLFLVTVSKLLFANRFSDFIEIISNFRYVRIYSRNQSFFDVFEAVLFCNLILGVSIFSYLSYQFFFKITPEPHIFLLKIGFLIAIIILAKVLFERLVGSYLDIEDLISNYLFYKISYKNFIGLLLIPVNFIFFYGISPSKIALTITFGLLLLINIIGILLFLRAHQKLILPHIFYFILYLCALEISPYIIIYKFVTDNMIKAL